MNTVTAFLKRHSLGMGLLLMFAFTWPIDLANSGLMPFQFPFLVYLFLGWGIVFAALLMTLEVVPGSILLATHSDSWRSLHQRRADWRPTGLQHCDGLQNIRRLRKSAAVDHALVPL